MQMALTLALLALPLASGMTVQSSAYARALGFYKKTYGNVRPNTYYYREPRALEQTFQEMSRIYSEEVAIQMVKEVPGVLTFKCVPPRSPAAARP